MSLYGSIQLAGNTLQAMQIGLHVVGNNIANANTPGYIREKAVFKPAPVQKIGNLTLGLGVQVAGIVQQVDKFLESRVRDASGDAAGAGIQDTAYQTIEGFLNALGDDDISSLLSQFVGAIQEVVKEPAIQGIRDGVVDAGETLVTQIGSLARKVRTVYQDFAQQTDTLTNEINTLAEEVRKLNIQIVQLEGGNNVNQAGGLRSQRQNALKRLSEIANIRVTESAAGAMNVAIGGEFLVFEGTRRQVETEYSSTDGLLTGTINFADTDSPLLVSSGELAGIYAARDNVVGGFLDKLDNFALTLANEFNKIHSQGFGATGYSSITSLNRVNDQGRALDEAGLAITPTNGSFHVVLRNTEDPSHPTKTTTIKVNLLGLDGDSSLASIAAQINAISGVTATITTDNRLQIRADSPQTEVAFIDDRSQPSGLPAALGINTFFTGTSAATLGINPILQQDSTKFAAALDGIGVENDNAIRMVDLYDQGLSSLGGSTIIAAFDQLVTDTTQGATVAKSVKEGFDVFKQTLEANASAISGVNLDEEAVDLILLQRTYQASAKYITTVAELLDVLVNL